MNKDDKWISVNQSGKLIIRFRVKGFSSQFFISTGLKDTSKNRALVRLKRDAIQSDIVLERFDPSLKSYQFKATRNTTTPQPQNLRGESKTYKYDLGEIWDKFTTFRSAIVEQTTILVRYRAIARYIEKLPTRDLKKAPTIRDWLLKNISHHMVWENLVYYSFACEWAVDSDLIPDNPFLKLKISKPKKKSNETKIKAFTLEQRDLIIYSFENHRLYSCYSDLIKFLFWTGCRQGEAFALTWADIQKDCTRIHINKAYGVCGIKKGTKNGKSRVFPTSYGSKLNELLLGMKNQVDPKDSELVFKSKAGNPCNGDTLRRCWYGFKDSKRNYLGVVRELASNGQVPYLKPYSTRHTFATWAISTGISPDKVAIWIGDEVSTVLNFYCHPDVVSSECPDF